MQVCFSFGFLSPVCVLLPPPPSRLLCPAATWLVREFIADAWEDTGISSVARDDCSSLSCWLVVLLLRLLPLVITLAANAPSVDGMVVGGLRSMRSSMWASCSVARSFIGCDVLPRRHVRFRWGLRFAAAVHSAQGRHAFVVFFFSLPFYATYFAVILFCEELDNRHPLLVRCVVIIANELGLEEPALVHLADEKDCFCCVRD